MHNYFTSHLFFSIIFLSLQGFISQNLIQDTCNTCSQQDPNINLNFCISSLQSSFPVTQSPTTLHDLATISIDLIQNNITDTTLFITNLIKIKTLDPFVIECLGDCLTLYSDAVYNMGQTMYYYNSSRYIDANAQISSIMDAATTCEDGFSENDDVESPLRKRNNDTFELCAVSLAIMHML